MTFLSGWVPIAIAAGLTIPPLVALYFLKLRRASLPVSSTLLWKRAVEDLQVNAPFQRIRNNLLLWLQLLVLVLAAFALGKPMIEAVRSAEDTLVVLIDHSASMGVIEAGSKTRLDIAKRQAQTVIDNMPAGSRAMVIAFSDRATIVSSFETDKEELKRRIGALQPTESSTTLSEAMALAEAYMQRLVIAGDEQGADIEVDSPEGPARAIILTDGNVADAERLTVKRLPVEEMEVICVGQRSDNVAILSMDAKRNYERPAALEVFAMVRNFGEKTVTLDANLYINGEHVDVQSMVLQAGRQVTPPAADEDADPDRDRGETDRSGARPADGAPPAGSVASVAFDEVEYEGGGVVEVRLTLDDALACDDKARTVIQPPRHVSVLLVCDGNVFLERLLPALPILFQQMSAAEYERLDEDELTVAGRSQYDVVIFENHSTKRLPLGSYVFLGGAPLIEGVAAGDYVDDEVIFNWDESHPVLRYVAIETVQVFRWLRLSLPPQAQILIEGETSPVMALLSRDGRQYLISGFGLLTRDDITGEPMLNTDWVFKAHFPVFVSNALQYLAGSLSPKGVRNVRPGEPMEFPVPQGTASLRVRRPNGQTDRVLTAGFATVHYARTRRVGVYEASPSVEGQDRFAVNLFDAGESDVTPRRTLTLSGETLEATGGVQRVNKPFWPWLLLAMVVVLGLEWAIYSKRVFV